VRQKLCLGIQLSCPVDAGFTQTPSHLVTGRGQDVTLSCEHDQSHDYMYWYLQDLGQEPNLGLQLIYSSFGKGDKTKGEAPGDFDVNRTETQNFFLKNSAVKTTDSSLYFCASNRSDFPKIIQ
uniref:Immunoglobulin V-set domain-containing protein n=1 Tax=Ornithorhynchus anatinus TaxID=9258 RepID=A0A6I8P823_ORNAN